MRYGSLFSGAGGFDIGFCRAGWTPAWFCEIDPTARAVLARHWPEVPCYEDIRQLDPAKLPAVDVLIGGFPCQDVSVAGRRAGLAGSRSGLFWEMARLIEGLRPTWLCLENVPGLLSSNGTEDLGAVLWALGELGYGWAYRVLDAQHWGVPQRRRRVFIVGHSGGLTERAAQVLFESEGRGGDSPAGGEAREELAYCLSASAGSSSSRVGQGWNTTYVSGFNARAGNPDTTGHTEECSPPVGGRLGVITPLMAAGAHGSNGAGIGQADDPMFTLDTTGAMAIADTVRSHPRPGSNSVGNLTLAATLRSRNHAPGVNAPGRGGEDDQNLVVASTIQASAGHHGHSSPRGDGGDNLVVALAENQRGELHTTDISPALGTGGGKPGSGESAAWSGSTVRRLLPVECERLQGWPPGWTEGHSDGARYRLIGNGVAAPVAEWIARRILAVDLAPRASAAGGAGSC